MKITNNLIEKITLSLENSLPASAYVKVVEWQWPSSRKPFIRISFAVGAKNLEGYEKYNQLQSLVLEDWNLSSIQFGGTGGHYICFDWGLEKFSDEVNFKFGQYTEDNIIEALEDYVKLYIKELIVNRAILRHKTELKEVYSEFFNGLK